jgi:UDP-N-acetylmuramoylalanine--D-glutamate ligase
VLLNVSPDHLDRHGTLDDYLSAKLRLFANQGPSDVSIYNGSDPVLRGAALGGRGRRLAFCRNHGDPGDCAVTVADGAIERRGERLVGLDELALIGPHNADNAAAAAAASSAMGIADEAIADGLRSFRGVAHRLEPVAEIGGVRFVNDSKATNVSAATAALRSFDGRVRAILGGSPKGESFAELAEPVVERCVACYLIGEAADALERDLARTREAGVELHRCADLADAVRRASGEALAGDVVLLAPACASFDAYRDFEERGEHFRELVRELR